MKTRPRFETGAFMVLKLGLQYCAVWRDVLTNAGPDSFTDPGTCRKNVQGLAEPVRPVHRRANYGMIKRIWDTQKHKTQNNYCRFRRAAL